MLATQAAKPPARLRFEEGAGLVPVEILQAEGRAVGGELTAPQPLSKLTPFSAEKAAACVSLAAGGFQGGVRLSTLRADQVSGLRNMLVSGCGRSASDAVGFGALLEPATRRRRR